MYFMLVIVIGLGSCLEMYEEKIQISLLSKLSSYATVDNILCKIHRKENQLTHATTFSGQRKNVKRNVEQV